jgi:hypothetical protein
MSSRNMCLLPRATLHSDNEQLLLMFFFPYFSNYFAHCAVAIATISAYFVVVNKYTFTFALLNKCNL